jgi:hypothetical protein
MTTRAAQILAKMKDIVDANQFKVYSFYPKDALIDEQIVLALENSVCSFGWVVGNTHTHLTVLGIHEDMNERVTYFLNLASSDKFYVFNLRANNQFDFKEVTRDEFASLQNTQIQYSSSFQSTALCWYKDSACFSLKKNQLEIAKIAIVDKFVDHNRKFEVKIHPMSKMLSSVDVYAATNWAQNVCIKTARSFFVPVDIELIH